MDELTGVRRRVLCHRPQRETGQGIIAVALLVKVGCVLVSLVREVPGHERIRRRGNEEKS